MNICILLAVLPVYIICVGSITNWKLLKHSTVTLNDMTAILWIFRLTLIDIKYQVWKFGVVFTDGVSKPILFYFMWCLTYCSLKTNNLGLEKGNHVLCFSADFSLPLLVPGNVFAWTLQQLFLCLSPAGYRHGCQDAAHHPVFSHTQWQTGKGRIDSAVLHRLVWMF